MRHTASSHRVVITPLAVHNDTIFDFSSAPALLVQRPDNGIVRHQTLACDRNTVNRQALAS